MVKYELLLVINPVISEADREVSLDNLRALFKKAKAKIEKEDIW
jgi:ribosomal protein S6